MKKFLNAFVILLVLFFAMNEAKSQIPPIETGVFSLLSFFLPPKNNFRGALNKPCGRLNKLRGGLNNLCGRLNKSCG